MRTPWVIIASWNGRHWLTECLATLVKSLPSHVQIVVVDNGSTDGSVPFVREHFPSAHVLPLERNLGFVQATNLGLHFARRRGADSYLLINNDTRFKPGWFEALDGAAARHPSFGILGVKQVSFEGKISPRTAVELKRWNERSEEDLLPEVLPTDWVEGSCLFVREEVIERIGFLDPLFAPAYFEEVDFCQRARSAGFDVGMVTTSTIEHAGAGTAGKKQTPLSERSYLLYQVTRPGIDGVMFPLIQRSIRHGGKQILAGVLRFRDVLHAFADCWKLRHSILAKQQRDRTGEACPLLGSAIPASPEQTHYREWINRIDQESMSDVMATSPTLRASVVIPVRNRTDDFERCLDCVLSQSIENGTFEVLVCDDGSEASVADRLRSICSHDARVRYLSQPHKGPAAARNLGAAHARAEIVVFTDSDTLPQPGWLKAILKPFASSEVIAVEGPVRPPRPAESPLEEAPRNEGGVHLTANMAYRRSTLVAVGGLDEEFPLPAFEDVDLALCAARHGKISFAEEALVIHPWRRVTLASSLRRLKQLDWLIVTAQRHGCLGWSDRPTRYPRLRVMKAALFSLPAGRIRKALKTLPRHPKDSLLRIGYSVAEAVVAWSHVPRWMGRREVPPRGRYLEGASS